jgi:phage baseplate assembly protein W
MAIRKFLSIEDGDLESTTFTTRKNRDYKDIDLTFTVKPGPAGVSTTGDVYKKTAAAAVKQAVKNLILTNEFEKPFDPDYGCNLREMLFDMNDFVSVETIRLKIEAKLRIYEPRIEIIRLDVVSEEDSYVVRVNLVANIINTGETITFTTALNRLR